jgi:hypothetical protein
MQLDHGHRWSVPIEKSKLRVEHEPSVPLRAAAAQKTGLANTGSFSSGWFHRAEHVSGAFRR